jgi:mono/diheme cytochrome c family protein
MRRCNPAIPSHGRLAACLLLCLFGASACSRRAAPPPVAANAASAQLRFVGTGATAQPLSKEALLAEIKSEVVETNDPYYQRRKRFLALPLAQVLARGFPGVDLRNEELALRALDGYAVPIAGFRLLGPDAYLAVADLDAPQWEPIGPRRVSPAPFYLIWKELGQKDLASYPRPWALFEIERARFSELYPHTVPRLDDSAESAAAQRGFSIFRSDCIRCHAINREGGRVGPELNVPQSIVEYRQVEQLREFIRNPLRFRYSAMPPHPHLTDEDLDGLVAYFRIMSHHKHDPDKKEDAPGDLGPHAGASEGKR